MLEGLAQDVLPSGLGEQVDLGAGQVDRRGQHVDAVALDDHLRRLRPAEQHVVDGHLDAVRVEAAGPRERRLGVQVDDQGVSPSSTSPAAREWTEVVFATPPFWFASAKTVPIGTSVARRCNPFGAASAGRFATRMRQIPARMFREACRAGGRRVPWHGTAGFRTDVSRNASGRRPAGPVRRRGLGRVRRPSGRRRRKRRTTTPA